MKEKKEYLISKVFFFYLKLTVYSNKEMMCKIYGPQKPALYLILL